MTQARRFGPLLRRVGARAGPGSLAPPNPLALNGGADLWLPYQSVTHVGLEVAAWDDLGVLGLRFEAPTAPQRPTYVDVGSIKGVQGDGTQTLLSDAMHQLTKPYAYAYFGRCESWVANERIVAFNTVDYNSYRTDSGQKLRHEHGSDDLLTTTPVADSDFLRVVVIVADNGNTGRIYYAEVEEDTNVGTTVTPANSTIGLLSDPSGGVESETTLFDVAMWDNIDLGTFDPAGIFAWHRYLLSKAA